MKNLSVEVTKVEKEVTVTDTGIADAVEKVYDSVVVVENYVNDRLYSTGSGFVFKTDEKNGYILTNHHVISDGTDIYVVLANNEKIEATIIDSDEYSDIGVLSIPVDKVIEVATIGSNENNRVGDTVFAIGAPIDSSTYSHTVTRGILSGKERLIEMPSSGYTAGNIMEALQTDAAINSGNSGGPLCNTNGEVIGINSMKLASDSIEGMGFAIPIEIALEYANAFINGEVISRPYLGIGMVDATNIYGSNLGVYVNYVENDSPAEKAGIEKGDKIIKIGDVEVSTTAYLKYEL